jgi:hypothetical protein
MGGLADGEGYPSLEWKRTRHTRAVTIVLLCFGVVRAVGTAVATAFIRAPPVVSTGRLGRIIRRAVDNKADSLELISDGSKSTNQGKAEELQIEDPMTRVSFLRNFVRVNALGSLVVAALAPLKVNAARVLPTETVGKDPDCNESTCLGVWDGILADCPHSNAASSNPSNTASCVSSQVSFPSRPCNQVRSCSR